MSDKEQYEKDLETAKQQIESEEEETTTNDPETEEEVEETPEGEEEEQQSEGEELSFEEEARAEGWVPLEEWNGSEDDWVDAETFVKRGREILPIVNSKLSKTQKELAELRDKFSRMDQANKEAIRRQQKQHMQELEDVRKEAFENQDYDKFREVEEEMSKIREEESAQEKEDDDPKSHPAVQDFLSRNTWYGQDEDLTAYADAISSKLDMPEATPEERLKTLEERVKKAFPHKFQKTRKKTVESGRGDGPARRSKGSKKKSYDDLPPEAQNACDEFVNEHGIMTTEEYVDSYFSQ